MDKTACRLIIAKDVMVPMRDGVRLATDVYRPAESQEAAPGEFPTILLRTAYQKNNYAGYGNLFVPHGYVVVLQDLRNRYNSEGAGDYFHAANPREGEDGYDTVEWIAAQPWSNGKVGTFGASFNGITQQVMALHRPPHLTTIWPDVAPINSYLHQAREGGAMLMHSLGALLIHALNAHETRDPAVLQMVMQGLEQTRDWMCSTPFKPGHTPLAGTPSLEKTLFDYYYRGVYDEYWQQESNDQSRHFHRHADIPATFTGGWYDLFPAATTQYFAAMQRQNTTQQRLIMGPWWHNSMCSGESFCGDVDFGPDSTWGGTRYNEEHQRWFDRWLKGEENGIDDESPVQIFVMGGGDSHGKAGSRTARGHLYHGGRWRNEQEWPLARTQYTPYYLQSTGDLSVALPPADGESACFTYDPAHPVPTISTGVTGFVELTPVEEHLRERVPPLARLRDFITVGTAHQAEAPGRFGCRAPYLPLAARPDVLVFQTEPLAEAVEVTGEIVVHLWISSSAVDTDFTAKLLDIYPPSVDYPDGYHMSLTDSIIRTRFRSGWDAEELMEPGTTYPVTITLQPTSNLFISGHRIRLDISSSNFPRFDLNPNTGEPLGRHTHQVFARNRVYCDAAHPSHVVLPIIPALTASP